MKESKCPKCGHNMEQDESCVVVDAMKRPIGKLMVCPACKNESVDEEDDD